MAKVARITFRRVASRNLCHYKFDEVAEVEPLSANSKITYNRCMNCYAAAALLLFITRERTRKSK